MKTFLAKIAFHKSLGLYIGEHEVSVSKVAETPLGPVQTAFASAPYELDKLGEVVEELLKPLSTHKQQLPLALGLPCSKLFFSTRLVPTGGASMSPESVLQKSLSSTNISVEDLTVDLLRSTVNKMSVASVAACRKKYLANVLATLGRIGVRPIRTEPAPCALIRSAAAGYRSPRRFKMIVRVFLSATHGLAVVAAGNLPLAWRQYALPEYSECFATLSAIRTLRTQVKHYGIEAPLDYVVVHGRPDLHARLEQDQFPTEVGSRVIWHDGPEFDGKAAALGLAIGCLSPDEAAFDLSRLIKVRPSIREIFPWGDLTFAGGLVVAMGAVLGAQSMQLEEKCTVLRTQCSGHHCLSSFKDTGKLEKETETLEQKINVVKRFVETRLFWSTYDRDLSVCLPEKAYLTSFQGYYTLDMNLNADARGRRSLSFRVMAAGPRDNFGSMPRDMDKFIETVRKHPLLKQDFPVVSIADIRPGVSRDGKFTTVGFTVNCRK